jgi:hypothetical protein
MNIPIYAPKKIYIDNDEPEADNKYESIKHRLALNNTINQKEMELLKIDYEKKILEQTHEIEQRYAKKMEDSLLEMREMLDSMKIKNEIQKNMLPTLHNNSSSEKYKTTLKSAVIPTKSNIKNWRP